MLGVDLTTYTDVLKRVPVHMNVKPMRSFDLAHAMGPAAVAYARTYVDDSFALEDHIHNLPIEAFYKLTFDQLCKLRMTSFYCMQRSVDDRFTDDHRYAVVEKIKSSMWRWGTRRALWNEIVANYECLRGFDFGHVDFEVRLDHTTSANECGYGNYSRSTFLDGVFAYLVYYRGEHVMTLGFSLAGGYRLLLQQVQLKSRRGNRWLFKLPRNYMEHVVARFRQAFPKHRLFVIDGGDLTKKYMNCYRRSLETTQERMQRTARYIKSCSGQDRQDYEDRLQRYADEIHEYEAKIAHITPEVSRLRDFYKDTGSFRQGRSVKLHGLRHYALTA